MSELDAKYHVFMCHPDYDEVVHNSFGSEEAAAEFLGQQLARRGQEYAQKVFIKVIVGFEVPIAATTNAVVVQVGEGKFLVDNALEQSRHLTD